ncbi:MAG: hypothetical protein ACYTXA_11050 [Nostoc sp.]
MKLLTNALMDARRTFPSSALAQFLRNERVSGLAEDLFRITNII